MRSTLAARAAAVLACLPIVFCAPPDEGASVTGTVTYRERIAMPPGATVEITLEDVSRMDAPATVIGRTTIEEPGSVPVAFAVSYDPADIVETNSYGVRARIRVGDELRWTSDTSHPVLTRGNGDTVDITVVGVGRRSDGQAPGALGGLPASFAGTVACASCPGIEMHLDLFPDRTFYLGRTYIDRGGPDEPARRDEWGRWSVSSGGDVLALHAGRESPVFLSIVSDVELRLRDATGEEIVSDLPYDLARSATFDPIEPAGQFRGWYGYQADAASFKECLTGKTYRVQSEDGGAIEEAFLAARATPDQELLAVIDGTLGLREGMEGGPRPTVVVRQFVRLLPGRTCVEGAPGEATP